MKKFPYVCNRCQNKTYCRKKKYYYNHIKAQENYKYILKVSRTGIDMNLDELYYWYEYFKDKLKNKNVNLFSLCNNFLFITIIIHNINKK